MHCFTRQQRLLNKAAYRYVFEAPQKLYSPYFTLFMRSNECGFPRLGLAISKKTCTKAVIRNRMKRAIRESFRQQNNLPAMDIVLVTKPGLKTLEMIKFRGEIEKKWLHITRL